MSLDPYTNQLLTRELGTIIGMIEPHKMAFSVEVTAIKGIFRKPLKRAARSTTFQQYSYALEANLKPQPGLTTYQCNPDYGESIV